MKISCKSKWVYSILLAMSAAGLSYTMSGIQAASTAPPTPPPADNTGVGAANTLLDDDKQIKKNVIIAGYKNKIDQPYIKPKPIGNGDFSYHPQYTSVIIEGHENVIQPFDSQNPVPDYNGM